MESRAKLAGHPWEELRCAAIDSGYFSRCEAR